MTGRMTMTSNVELRKIAASHLGQGGARFRKFAGLPAGAAWCNAFVDYVANEGGVSSLYFNGKKETYCPHSIKWCAANLAVVPAYMALPMDLIYFDWDKNGNPNHIGFVWARKSTSEIYTIEGNTDGGKVARKVRNVKYVQAVYRTHFKPNVELKKCKLDGKGLFGYLSTYNFQLALGMKATGILTKETVKFWQKKVGATQDGVWSTGTSRKAQAFLAKEGLYNGKIDGDFGPASTSALQKWCNKVNFPVKKTTTAPKSTNTAKKPATTTKTPTATKKPATPAKKGYSGTFPTLNTNSKIINGFAYTHCWPYGTAQNKYTYKKGKPRAAYSKGIDKAYPGHKSWPNKKQKVGACCDIYVGECLGNVGIKVPKDLKNQLTQMPKMTKDLKSNGHYLAKDFRAGDVVQRGRKDYSGHTFVIVVKYSIDKKTGTVKGTKYIANAHYKKLGGTYAVMDSKAVTQKPSKWKFYKCYTPLGAVRTYYQKGDYGLDVYLIQKFLKWAGYYKGALGFTYNDATVTAVKAFQKAVGLKVSGRVGELTIKKMKAVKK